MTTLREQLRALGVKWQPEIISTLADAPGLVARGEGVALSLFEPSLVYHEGIT